MSAARDARTKQYVECVFRDASMEYHTNPRFHNRVDLAVDIIRGRHNLTPQEMKIASEAAAVTLLLQQDDAAKDELMKGIDPQMVIVDEIHDFNPDNILDLTKRLMGNPV